MEEIHNYRQRLLERFIRVVDELESILLCQPQSLTDKEGRNILQVANHLRDVEERVFIPIRERILQEEHPMLDDLNNTMVLDIPGQFTSLESIMEAFRRLRIQWIEQSRNLPADAWNRTARHPRLGVHTLQWWLEQSLLHSEKHLERFLGVLDSSK